MSDTQDPTTPPDTALSDELIAELEDYLAAGREPRNQRFEEDPELSRVLGSLENLHRVTAELLDAEARDLAAPDPGWVQKIMTNIVQEARSGRSIPLTAVSEADTLSVTEGAVRTLVRDAGDAVPGILIGRCRLDGDVTDPAAAIAVRLTVSVAAGQRIPEVTARLRAAVIAALERHTELTVSDVDISVVDLYEHRTDASPAPEPEENR